MAIAKKNIINQLNIFIPLQGQSSLCNTLGEVNVLLRLLFGRPHTKEWSISPFNVKITIVLPIWDKQACNNLWHLRNKTDIIFHNIIYLRPEGRHCF